MLRKFSEFNGRLIKMRLQWFLLCLILFCTHATTSARPNINNNLHEANLAADANNFQSNVSIYFVNSKKTQLTNALRYKQTIFRNTTK